MMPAARLRHEPLRILLPRTPVNRARMKGAALAIELGWQGGAVRRSMVVFVASFMLGAWISLLMYGSPPEWLERVMNSGENCIEIRIPRSDWFPLGPHSPHS